MGGIGEYAGNKNAIKKFGNSNGKSQNLIFNDFIKREELRKMRLINYMSTKLWKIPQPEEVTFDGRGEKKLFHYTLQYQLGSILKDGIVMGGVMFGNNDGLNAPNLTTESEFHNPSNYGDKKREQHIYRLRVKCPTDADKLINMGWFDRRYNLNRIKKWNKQLTEERKVDDDISGYIGDVEKQYIYKGHITTKMIKEVCRWNKETEYWDRVNKKELNEIISSYENLPFINQWSDSVFVNRGRVFGYSLKNDLTGMLKKFNEENDHKEVLKDLYEVTDWVTSNLNNKLYYLWRMQIDEISARSDLIPLFVDIAVTWYNRFNKNNQLDSKSIMNNIERKIEEYRRTRMEFELLPVTV